MIFHDWSRRIFLKIPRASRFYNYASELASSFSTLQEQNKILVEEMALLAKAEQTAQARADAAASELDKAKAEIAELEFKLYILRADHQRAVRAIDELQGELKELRANKEELKELQANYEEELRANKEELKELQANCEEELRANKEERLFQRVAADFEQRQARLLGRLTMIAADVADVRRAFRGSAGDQGDLTLLRQRYLDTLEKALTGQLYGDHSIAPWGDSSYDPDVRLIGRDWPARAQTMIGSARMRSLRTLIETVLTDNIPGDLLEAGVWRGGASIYMRGILAAYGTTNRKVWAADSFAGLPPPTPDLYPADAGDRHSTVEALAVSLDEVKKNFALYDLLDNQVVFVQGWFKDTLPELPVDRLAILRLDGDMYSSTIETLEALYLKVQLGGYIIIDDYILPACRQAVHDFRAKMEIHEAFHDVDGAAVYWRKEK